MPTAQKINPANRGAQLLVRWRETHGISQGGLAAQVGMHEQTISKYERGACLPSRSHATTLHQHCQIPTGAWDQPAEALAS